MAEDRNTQETIIDDGNADTEILSPTENQLQELLDNEDITTISNLNKQNVDCASEKVLWKYARCILYLNLWLSQFRLLIYAMIGIVRFMCCDIEKGKAASIEVLKSFLVIVSALAAIYVTQNFANIFHCIGEVFFEFLIGGLTLQICLGLGDAFIRTLFGCTTINCTVHSIVESILEPIVFIGGFFSIFIYSKSVKGSTEAQHAKYSALGNFIGSFIAIVLASYLCLQIEENARENAIKIAALDAQNALFQKQMNDLHHQLYELRLQLNPNETETETKWDDFTDGVKELYDKKNAVLAANVIARIFAEGIAKCVEHKCIYRRFQPNLNIVSC